MRRQTKGPTRLGGTVQKNLCVLGGGRSSTSRASWGKGSNEAKKKKKYHMGKK